MDLFESRNIKPMLIAEEKEPFDSNKYLYELKIDGIRCISYIDKNSVDLRNKRNDKVLFRYPEMALINKQLNCNNIILDGELFIMNNGKTDFFEMQRRSLMSDSFKIELLSKKLPVSFVAFDIIYKDGIELTDLPLFKRKEILQNSFVENNRLCFSRFTENDGIKLFELTTQNGLEGIVAKKKDSKYFFDKRSKDWIKFKNYEDEDFIICGYIEKDSNLNSIIIAQYDNNSQLIYKGHVTLGISNYDFNIIKKQRKLNNPIFNINDNAIWIEPCLVCTVKFMHKTDTGSLRQPVYKGLRNDKLPQDCIVMT